jgi:hypothetical protein
MYLWYASPPEVCFFSSPMHWNHNMSHTLVVPRILSLCWLWSNWSLIHMLDVMSSFLLNVIIVWFLLFLSVRRIAKLLLIFVILVCQTFHQVDSDAHIKTILCAMDWPEFAPGNNCWEHLLRSSGLGWVIWGIGTSFHSGSPKVWPVLSQSLTSLSSSPCTMRFRRCYYSFLLRVLYIALYSPRILNFNLLGQIC